MIQLARTARRSAPAALAALAVALAACGSEERPPERAGGGGAAAGAPAAEGTIRIGLPTGKTSFANTDVVVADKQGFFREQGLEIELINFGSGLKSVQAVIGGGADIAGASIEPVVAAAAQGQPVRIIGAYADRLTVNMVTPKAIAEPEDLEGQPIGIQDVGAFREIMARYILQRAELTPMTSSTGRCRPPATSARCSAARSRPRSCIRSRPSPSNNRNPTCTCWSTSTTCSRATSTGPTSPRPTGWSRTLRERPSFR
jgi:ABC-type nitrate/sulfonate/bicarbonate transport system substrate-binding protein